MKTTDNQKELFIVVDRNDKIIDYKSRRECHSNKKLIHRAIHILITNNKSELLMQKRSKSKDMQPGFYTVSVGGHVVKGETYRSTARRELTEELGIKIPFKEILKYLVEVEDQSEMIMVYQGESNGPFKTNTEEIESIQFFSKPELKKLATKITPISLLTLKKLNIL